MQLVMNCNKFPYQVIINGAAKEIGRAAVVAVTKARGMDLAGAVDNHFLGEDIGLVT